MFWVYNGQEYYNGISIEQGENVFTISSFEISQVGVYQCIVENEYQYSSRSVSFYVKGSVPTMHFSTTLMHSVLIKTCQVLCTILGFTCKQ